MNSPATLPPAPQDSPGPLDDLRSWFKVLARGWWIIAASALIGLTAAVIHVARTKPVHLATSRLLIIQQDKSPLRLGSAETGQFAEGVADYIPTHALVLRSPLVVGHALALLGKEDLAVHQAIDGLTITRPDEKAKIVQLNYKSADSGFAVKMVAAITESYKDFLGDNYQKKNKGAIFLMRKARDELSRDLQQLEREFLELRQRQPALITDESGRSFLAHQLDEWDKAASEAMIKAARLKSQLELGRKLEAEGASLRTVEHAMGQVDDSTGHGLAPLSAAGHAITLRNRVGQELTEVEIQIVAAEQLLAQLRGKSRPSTANRAGGDSDLAQAFYAEPGAAKLRDEIRATRGTLTMARRLARHSNDPSLTQAQAHLTSLDRELQQLWRQRRPALLEQQGELEEGNVRVRDADANLMALRAREASLRRKVDELDAEQIRDLEEQGRHLARRLGRDDRRVVEIREKAARIRQGGSDSADHSDRAVLRELLGAVEKSLESVEVVREEFRKRFNEGLAASKEVEIGRLAESNLRSNLERQRALFNTVLDQLKQTQLAGDFSGTTAQTIDPPRAVAVRSQGAVLLFMGLLIGCGLGIGIVVVLEQLDPRIRSIDEIRKVFNLSTLGIIPQLSGENTPTLGRIGLIGQLMPRSTTAESYRVVRTNMGLQRRDRRLQVIMVTSPVPGDGKTTTASNLAISLAQAGKRVLLIDADLRAPTIDQLYNVSRGRGLTQILLNQSPLLPVVQPSQVKNLDLITAGPEVTNPAELLTSPRLGAFLDAVRQSHDAIILDAPPLLTVADAAILGGMVDGIVLVVRASAIRRHEAKRVLELLRAIGTPVLGTVINRADRSQYGSAYATYGPQGAAKMPRVAVDLPTAARREIIIEAAESVANVTSAPSTPEDPFG